MRELRRVKYRTNRRGAHNYLIDFYRGDRLVGFVQKSGCTWFSCVIAQGTVRWHRRLHRAIGRVEREA